MHDSWKNVSKLGEKGFSLTEVMIALGLMLLISTLFIGFMQMSNSANSNMKAQAGKESLETSLRRTMASPAICAAAIGTSQTFNAPTATAPGVTDIAMTIAGGSFSDVVHGSADLSAHWDLKIAPNGFRVIVPQGATGQESGPERVWTGVLQLSAEKAQTKLVGGDRLATSMVGTIRLRVDTATNKIVACEGDDAYSCPEGFVQTGPLPTDCKTPIQILAEVCKAGEIPVSTGVSIDCKDPKALFTGLCPSGTVPVTTTGALECRGVDTLTTVCGVCQIPIPGPTGTICQAVPDCGTVPGPAVPVCEKGDCATAGEIKYDAILNKPLECDGSCWQLKSTTLSCLPPGRIKKGDDEWMNFHQDSSMRRAFGSPCEPAMRSGSMHATMISGGTKIRFDDTSKTCATDQNCVEVP